MGINSYYKRRELNWTYQHLACMKLDPGLLPRAGDSLPQMSLRKRFAVLGTVSVVIFEIVVIEISNLNWSRQRRGYIYWLKVN